MDEGWQVADPSPVPEPLAIDGPATLVVRRGSGRLRLAVVAVATAGLLGGALVVVANSDTDPDPHEVLAAAQEVVEGSDSYRFHVLQTSRVVTGEPGGAGSETTNRIVTSGVVAARDHWSVSVDYGEDPMMASSGGSTWESIRIGGTIYSDTGSFYGREDPEELPGPMWVAEPAELYELTTEDIELAFEDLDEYPDDAYRLDLTLAAYFMHLDGDPTTMTRLVSDATDPVLEEEVDDGTVVLQARLAPLADYESASDEPIPPVDLRLEVDESYRPVRALFSASAGDATADVEVTFDDWGAPLTVDPPAESELDRTPWIQEEALAVADPALMVAPAALPGGWVLSDAYRLLADPEFDACESIELTYSSEADRAFLESEEELSAEELDEAWQELDYLDLSTSTLECMLEVDDTPFDAELAGLPARGETGSWEVQVGDLAVYISTSLPDDVVAPMLASVRPVTVAELAAAIPDWIQELHTSGL